jgi:hypothetical protein
VDAKLSEMALSRDDPTLLIEGMIPAPSNFPDPLGEGVVLPLGGRFLSFVGGEPLAFSVTISPLVSLSS